jgi:mitochondrial fission protein ELM1
VRDCTQGWNDASRNPYNRAVKPLIQALTHHAVGVCVISDGAAGNERQALALAHAMQLTPMVQRVALRAPWRWMGPAQTRGLSLAMPRAQWRELSHPWPALAIGCGRHAAVVTRALRETSGGATFTVQILDPRVDPAHFDLVIAPRHDDLDAPNAIQTMGSLNPIDDAWLAAARTQFPLFEKLARPRTALLVGGPRHGLELDARWMDRLIDAIERWHARDGGSVLIATSRRTPPEWRERLRGAFRNGCSCFWGGDADGPNPYAGYLAHADRIVVTPDSVNMLSEACAVGVPVFTALPANAPAKLAAFHAELRDQGWLHDFHAVDVDTRQPPPLREIATVASKVWHQIEATRPDVAALL